MRSITEKNKTGADLKRANASFQSYYVSMFCVCFVFFSKYFPGRRHYNTVKDRLPDKLNSILASRTTKNNTQKSKRCHIRVHCTPNVTEQSFYIGFDE